MHSSEKKKKKKKKVYLHHMLWVVLKKQILRKKILKCSWSFLIPTSWKNEKVNSACTVILMLPHDGQGFSDFLDFWGRGYAAKADSDLFRHWNLIAYTI